MSTIIPYTSWHHTAAAAGAVDWSIQILVNGLPVGCSSRSARTSDQRHESQVLFGGVTQPAPHGASCTHSHKQQHKVKIQDADMTRCIGCPQLLCVLRQCGGGTPEMDGRWVCLLPGCERPQAWHCCYLSVSNVQKRLRNTLF